MDLHLKQVQELIDKTYKKVKSNNGGKVASYIPQLAKADPKLFGIAFVSCNGDVIEAGEATKTIPIESISKVFSLAMAVEDFGVNVVDKKIGNVGSSLPFNSIIGTVLSPSHTINPFVNQGAIATTSLFYKKNKTAFRKKVLDNMDNFAGRHLPINMPVYRSEGATNSTNMALAYLLKSFNRFYGDVDDTVDIYTEQCSKNVSAKDLASMASVFANGGTHPLNGKKIISPDTATYVYRALRGEGLYEYSAKWDTDVGCISAKSGVGGGIFVILKGIGGIGIVSPPLDKIGNSVRGIKSGTIISNGIYKIYNARRHFNYLNTFNKTHSKKTHSKKTRSKK